MAGRGRRAPNSPRCPNGSPKPPAAELQRRNQSAEAAFRQLGITFAVYGENEAAERIIPFDIVPRVFLQREWGRLCDGLVQRVEAINAFLEDIYGERRILAEGIIPPELVLMNEQFRPEVAGIRRRTASGRTSAGSTWCAQGRMNSTFSRTMRGPPRACRTCSRTARR